MKKREGLTVISNEYAVTNRHSDFPVLISLGVSVCTAIAVMVKNDFNHSAMAHFSAHAKIRTYPEGDLQAYVEEGVQRILNDLHWQPGMQARYAIAGGYKNWGDYRQSELVSMFAEQAFQRVEGMDKVLDRAMLNRPVDLFLDAKNEHIRVVESEDFGCLNLDNIKSDDDYGSPAHMSRLNNINAGVNNPSGTCLSLHYLSCMSP